MSTAVITAADGAAWESTLLAELDGGNYDIEIVRRCVDVIDLLAVAGSGQAAAALIDAQLRRLDADVVDRLRAAGVAVVAVVAPGGELSAASLEATGIAHVVPADSAAAVVASVVELAVTDTRDVAATPNRDFATAPMFAKSPSGFGGVGPVTPLAPVGEDGHLGVVIAVWVRPAGRGGRRSRCPWPTNWPGWIRRAC